MALVSGFWGQNIGNAFFNIGGKWVLEQAFPDYRVEFIQDQPGYRTFHKQTSGNPKNDLGLLKHLEVDVIVLQGPMLTQSFQSLWEGTFSSLSARGTRIILLSAALSTYTTEEIHVNREFLRRYPPALVVTRDRQTFEAFKDHVPAIYDGIDSAFFVSKAYVPFDLDLPEYVTINFDRYPEPEFFVEPNPNDLPTDINGSFEVLGGCWGFKSPGLQSWFANGGQWQAYLGALLDRRRLPTRLGDRLVIRTEHRFNPHVTWKIYSQRNVVASDEPFTYFTLYGGTSLTLSDRVHACVATLAFGRPAMLFSPTPRSAVFSRLGLEGIRDHPVWLEPSVLEAERSAEVAFLSRNAGALAPLPL